MDWMHRDMILKAKEAGRDKPALEDIIHAISKWHAVPKICRINGAQLMVHADGVDSPTAVFSVRGNELRTETWTLPSKFMIGWHELVSGMDHPQLAHKDKGHE